MKIYCSHIWISYTWNNVAYDFCHRCRTTYIYGSGLIRPEVEIGHTLTDEEMIDSRILKSDFKERKV